MTSSFLPEYRDFPVGNPPELERVLVQTYIDIAQSSNFKEIGQYETIETVTGQRFFDIANPQVKFFTFRKSFAVGAIAAGASINIAHGITGIVNFTRIYGTCVTDVVDYRPIPMVSTTALNEQISVKVDATNIVITNGAAAPNITSGLIVLEYIRT